MDTEQTEQVITAKREKYRPLAARGAVIYFVVASLAEIDPMYQYSLKYFTQIFSSVISVPHAKMPTDERIKTLKMDELKAIFENVSRGLFEKHKLVFSFLLATTVEKQVRSCLSYLRCALQIYLYGFRKVLLPMLNSTSSFEGQLVQGLIIIDQRNSDSCLIVNGRIVHFWNSSSNHSVGSRLILGTKLLSRLETIKK